MKEDIIQNLSTLLSYNVRHETSYKNRYNGFVGELDFREWFLHNRRWDKIYSGGFFVPTLKKANALDNPVYFTTSIDEPQSYGEIYRRIAKLGCKAMYFIKWDSSVPFSTWRKEDLLGVGIPLPVPPFLLYVYDVDQDSFILTTLAKFLNLFTRRNRPLEDKVSVEFKERFSELLDRFDGGAIMDLYVQRLFFDGFIGLGKVRGIPSDIDMVIRSKDEGQLIAFEVKEKDLTKTEPKGFGMDVKRIAFFETFMDRTGIDVYYMVRQIDNQSSRKIIAWRTIPMRKFIACVDEKDVEGGTGMGLEDSSNPTWICEDRYFKCLEQYH